MISLSVTYGRTNISETLEGFLVPKEYSDREIVTRHGWLRATKHEFRAFADQCSFPKKKEVWIEGWTEVKSNEDLVTLYLTQEGVRWIEDYHWDLVDFEDKGGRILLLLVRVPSM